MFDIGNKTKYKLQDLMYISNTKYNILDITLKLSLLKKIVAGTAIQYCTRSLMILNISKKFDFKRSSNILHFKKHILRSSFQYCIVIHINDI